MNGDALIKNVFNLFVIAIILEASVMALFSMAILKDASRKKPVEIARDTLILALSLFLCYKVRLLTLFKGTGIDLPVYLDMVISALVLTRMSNFIREFIARIRIDD